MAPSERGRSKLVLGHQHLLSSRSAGHHHYSRKRIRLATDFLFGQPGESAHVPQCCDLTLTLGEAADL